jgi:hypothetical protein
MKTIKQKNLVMIMIAAAILVAVNAGILVAAGKGAIGPIENLVLWGGFVVLNVASILWAVSLLGLQPFVVALSYVAGGFLAFQGVRGMGDISVAEVTTAGATYGAFGALAIGNATAKVRLAFFNKGQVPFIFIIVGLLVVDAVLNSGISSANGSVILNAVVFPFIIAGVVVGLIWSVLNRYGIGRKPAEVLAEVAAEERAEKAEEQSAVASEKLVIQMPENAVVAKEEPPAKKVEVAEPVAPAAVVAEPVPVAKKKVEEEFFPLEIDKNEDYELPEDDSSLMSVAAMMDEEENKSKEESFVLPTFDSSLYASGSADASSQGNVMVKEPEVSISADVEARQDKVVAEEKAPAPVESQPEPAPVQKAEPEKKGDDWLGGHLDLLNKLK